MDFIQFKDFKIRFYPSTSIGNEPFFLNLHRLINEAYKPTRPDWPFPDPFFRLHPDLKIAGDHLKDMGSSGFFAVAFASDHTGGGLIPVSCAAAEPFGGFDEKEKQNSIGSGKPIEEWEFSYVMTLAPYRGQGVGVTLIKLVEQETLRRSGLTQVRLITRSVDEVAGDFWRARKYSTVEEGWVTLPKGFTHIEGFVGLPKDVVLWAGERSVMKDLTFKD
jgi:GNAT superfamily N-acetyltransferase